MQNVLNHCRLARVSLWDRSLPDKKLWQYSKSNELNEELIACLLRVKQPLAAGSSSILYTHKRITYFQGLILVI